MPPFYTHRKFPAGLQKATALLCMCLVLCLSWLAVDPVAHGALHHGHHGEDCSCSEHKDGVPDDSHDGHASEELDCGCIVTAFAQGIEASCPPLHVLEGVSWTCQWKLPVLVAIPSRRTALLPPACGPPGHLYLLFRYGTAFIK